MCPMLSGLFPKEHCKDAGVGGVFSVKQFTQGNDLGDRAV